MDEEDGDAEFKSLSVEVGGAGSCQDDPVKDEDGDDDDDKVGVDDKNFGRTNSLSLVVDTLNTIPRPVFIKWPLT